MLIGSIFQRGTVIHVSTRPDANFQIRFCVLPVSSYDDVLGSSLLALGSDSRLAENFFLKHAAFFNAVWDSDGRFLPNSTGNGYHLFESMVRYTKLK